MRQKVEHTIGDKHAVDILAALLYVQVDGGLADQLYLLLDIAIEIFEQEEIDDNIEQKADNVIEELVNDLECGEQVTLKGIRAKRAVQFVAYLVRKVLACIHLVIECVLKQSEYGQRAADHHQY